MVIQCNIGRNTPKLMPSYFYFRFGRRFELPLLAQSFIMIFAMLMLLQLCTQVLRESNLSGKRRRFAGVCP